MSKKKNTTIHTAGKRKTAIARATLQKGVGTIRINKVLLDNLTPKLFKHRIMEPLMLLDKSLLKSINLDVDVKGGGLTSQSDAVRIAMCRAFCEFAGGAVREKLVSYDRALLVADTRVKEKSKQNAHEQAESKRQKS